MKKSWIKWFEIGLLAVIIFVVGVPIIINECYKANSGYITMWGAADVLSYYGTVLGALVAAITIVVTINFTRKQIQRENYLKNQTEKWSKIEKAFMEAASIIDPYQSIIETMDHASADPESSIIRLQKYQVESTCAFDQILIFTSREDYLKFREVVTELEKIRDRLCEITQAKIEAYEKLRRTADYEIARKLLDYETDSHETLPPRIRVKCQRVIEQGYDSKLDALYAEIDLATEAAAKVYADEFRPALSKKREIFEAIYRSIQEQADCILQFDGTK